MTSGFKSGSARKAWMSHLPLPNICVIWIDLKTPHTPPEAHRKPTLEVGRGSEWRYVFVGCGHSTVEVAGSVLSAERSSCLWIM